MPASSCSRSSAYMRDRPSEAASRPGRFGRQIEPCRIGAAHDRWRDGSSGSVARPNSSIIVSKVQCLAAMAPEGVLDVEGRGVEAFGRPSSPRSARRRERPPSGSTKRRISQGQAMRSILGRARVTQTVRPLPSRRRDPRVRHERQPAVAQASKPPSRTLASLPRWRSQAAAPWLSFRPALADDDGRLAGRARLPQFDRWQKGAGRSPESGADRRRNPHRSAHR